MRFAALSDAPPHVYAEPPTAPVCGRERVRAGSDTGDA